MLPFMHLTPVFIQLTPMYVVIRYVLTIIYYVQLYSSEGCLESGDVDMRIAICDNRIDFLCTTKNILQMICKKQKIFSSIESFLSTEDLLFSFEKNEYAFDLVLMYTGMPGMTAGECSGKLRKINKSFKLVFLTSCETNIYDLFCYDVSAVIPDFMHEEYMVRELMRIVSGIGSNEIKYLPFEIKSAKGGFTERKMRISDIVYFNVMQKTVYIHTFGNVYILRRRSFNELKSFMSNYRFIEIHRACIVNIEYIRFIEGNELQLDNGKMLKISRRQIKNVVNAFSYSFHEELSKNGLRSSFI